MLRIIYCGLLIGTCCVLNALGSFNCPNSKITPEQRQELLIQHNRYRSRLANGREKNAHGKSMPKGKNMYELIYHCGLEKSAQKWADKCLYEHSPESKARKIGENLYSYWFSQKFPKEKIRNAFLDAGKLWWEELPKYYPNNPSNILYRELPWDINHFLQMAWGKTYAIGCGIATNCRDNSMNQLIVVCQYHITGNNIGEKIYEIGNPCKKDSDCRSKSCNIKLGLCKKVAKRS